MEKREIIVVSEHNIGTLCGIIFMRKIIQGPPLYIEIQIYSKHENEDLVPVEEETISTSPSPLEFHEVGPSKKEEDEEVNFQEPHFI